MVHSGHDVGCMDLAMTTYVRRNGKIVAFRPMPKHSVVAVISDSMEPLKHHGTGRTLDSKSAFRRDTRACGAVEIGTEAIKPRASIPLDRGARREAIRQSLYNLRNGR